MRYAILDHDLIVGTSDDAANGPALPGSGGHSHLRWLNGQWVDVTHQAEFWIDAAGQKHGEALDPSWQPIACMLNARLMREDGVWRVQTAPESLDLIKVRLKDAVDLDAERVRLRFVTGGAGQAMTYQAKVDEARRLADDPAPDDANYPLLTAEIGITSDTLLGVSAVVMQAYQAWIILGAQIEGARLGAKKAIDEAGTAEVARAARDAVVWPE